MTIHMTRSELQEAIWRFGLCAPNRTHVAQVVRNLAAWADTNSDGWVYWPKPARAATSAMAEIRSTTWVENAAQEQNDLTDAQVRRVLAPVKTFLTYQERLGRLTRADRNYILAG